MRLLLEHFPGVFLVGEFDEAKASGLLDFSKMKDDVSALDVTELGEVLFQVDFADFGRKPSDVEDFLVIFEHNDLLLGFVLQVLVDLQQPALDLDLVLDEVLEVLFVLHLDLRAPFRVALFGVACYLHHALALDAAADDLVEFVVVEFHRHTSDEKLVVFLVRVTRSRRPSWHVAGGAL